MLNFQKVTPNDGAHLRKLFSAERCRFCDESAGTILMWRSFLSIQMARESGCTFLQYGADDGGVYYLPPLGDLALGMRLLSEHCRTLGEELRLICVGEKFLDQVLSFFADPAVTFDRDFCDYLYETEKMITFAGRKLAGQRNHRNYFLSHYPHWRFETITAKNLPAVQAFFDRYAAQNQKSSRYYIEEMRIVQEVLDHPDWYDYRGGALFAEDKVCAFSFGEIVGDTMICHIEKADRTVRGAYPMITSEFLRHFAKPDTRFVNREEDMGEDGLRTSKLAYHPVALLKKYTVKEK